MALGTHVSLADQVKKINIRLRDGIILFITGLFAIFFIASIGISPLYTSNQNTKFLHGLAKAFPDHLGNDWTSRTVDGLPVFSYFVFFIARYFDPFCYYIIEALLLGILFLSLLSIARIAAPKTGATLPFVVIVGSMLILYTRFKQYMLDGVAYQYITSAYLQPSEFGILYLPALLFAIKGRKVALLIAVVPAAFHPGYFLLSVLLFVVIILHWRKSGTSSPSWIVILALAILIAPPIDLALRFFPTDLETFESANKILAFTRIPHHSDPLQWANFGAFTKLLIVVAALAMTSEILLRSTLVGGLALAIGGTLLVILTRSAEVALIAPWRVSIVIVPVAAAILTGALGHRLISAQ